MQTPSQSTARRLILSAAIAGTVSAWPTVQIAHAGTTGPLVTISLSGSTAMRSFITSPGFSYLTPGTSITLDSGTFTAPTGPTTAYQLAPSAYPAGASEVNGLRVEWHEQGSVEGILEMANSQIAPLAAGVPSFNNGNNPVWVNRNKFTGPGTINNFTLGDFGTPTGQSAVQMAISDVNARQGFSRAGSGAYNANVNSPGYGQGNTLLATPAAIGGLGSAGARQQLQPESVLNMPASSAGSGPWNTAGVDNLDNKQVAVTATLFVANPGTGLTKLNRSDSQWLQTTGRLANGADFNVAQRDVNSGTRNVAALNSGVDPSWAVGENDNGDNSNANQTSVGPNVKFSGKTAGGALRTTVQNSRMAIGPLSISDSIGVVRDGVTGSQSTTPLRALDYADSATDAGASFVRASATTITDGTYVIFQNETYVTVKAPNAAFAGDSAAQWAARTDAETGIKGDTAGHDVADVRGNILGTVANFPSSTSVADPADQLLATSFILPQMVSKTKQYDGIGTQVNNPNYNANLRGALLGSSYANNFAVGDPSKITSGASGALYNGATNNGTLGAGSIAITDTGSGHGNYLFGNFNQNGIRDYSAVKASLAAAKALYTADAGVNVNSGIANSTAIAVSGSAVNGMTKGDLIVMGDYNSDGAFDGKDIYAMAHGAALSTNTGVETLASGDYRTGVLRKNAALDYMQSNTADASAASNFLRTSARNAYQVEHGTNASGTNSFNKFDVDRSGTVDRNDAAIVDKFISKDYANLGDVLSSTINKGSTSTYATGDLSTGTNQRFTSGTQILFNLVDAKLIDGSTQILRTDFNLLASSLVSLGALDVGDLNFDGVVDNKDITGILGNFGNIAASIQLSQFSGGDANGDGVVDNKDLTVVLNDFGNISSAIALYNSDHLAADGVYYDAQLGAFTAVPEPASLSAIALAGLTMLGRRRKSC